MLLPLKIVETQELTSQASSVTFSNIGSKVPSGSKHLVLLVSAASPDAVNEHDVCIRFNGDSGNNYGCQLLDGDGTGAPAYRLSESFIRVFTFPGTNYANSYGGGVVLMPHAFNTSNHKAVLALGGAVEQRVRACAGRWANTSAISSITVLPNTGNFASGSRFVLAVVDEDFRIAEADLTVDGTVTFDNITQEEGDLVVIGYARSDRAAVNDSVLHEINDDTTVGNYYQQRLIGYGSSASAIQSNDNNVGRVVGDTATANAFGALLAAYSQYIKGNQPHYLSFTGYCEASDSRVKLISGRRANTAAITKLEFYPNVGTNFKAGSWFGLYRVPKVLLDRIELGTDQASVTFDSIPSGFETLLVNVYARGDRADVAEGVNITINDDTLDDNYDTQSLYGAGTSVIANRSTATRYFLEIPGDTEGANEFGGGVLIFPAYDKTDRHKHILTFYGRQENIVQVKSCRWESTSAITKIQLTPRYGTNFKAGSVFELIGIKATGAVWDFFTWG